jgi:hypothetical protein
VTDDLLKERVTRAAEGATPTLDLDAVVRRSQTLRRRRVGAAIAVGVVLLLGFAVPLSTLTGLRGDRVPVPPATSLPSPSAEPTPSRSLAPPVVIAPPSWFVQPDPLPALISPQIPFAAGTYDFPRPPLVACGTQPALEQLPADAVFVWIYRYSPPDADSADTAQHPPWPDRFSLDLPHRHGDRECAAGTGDVRDYRFWAEDHTVQVLVGIGPDASDRLLRELEDVVSSYEP